MLKIYLPVTKALAQNLELLDISAIDRLVQILLHRDEV